MTSRRATTAELESRLTRADERDRAALRADLAWAVRRDDVTRAEQLADAVLASTEEPSTATRARALLTRGFAASWTGSYADAVERTEEALAESGPGGDRLLHVVAHDQLVRALCVLERWDSAREHAAAAEALACSEDAREERIIAGCARGTLALAVGDDAIAGDCFQRVLDLSESSDDVAIRVEAMVCLGIVQWRRGNGNRAVQVTSDALRLATEAGDRASIARAGAQIGNLYRFLGCPLQARSHLSDALDLATTLRYRRGRAVVLSFLALVDRSLGALDDALESVRASLDEFRTIGDRKSVATSLQLLSAVHRGRGELDDAELSARATIELQVGAPETRVVAAAELELAQVFAARGDRAQSIEHFERSARLFEERGSHGGVSLALVGAASQHLDHGDAEGALVVLDRVLPCAERLDSSRRLARVYALRAAAYEELGDFESAYRASKDAQRLSSESAAREAAEKAEHLRVVLELEHVRERAAEERLRCQALDRVNAALARGNEGLRSLVQIVARDLRVPLTTVRTGAEQLSAATPAELPRQADAMIPPVVSAAEKIEEIIASLLDAGAVRAGGADGARESLDLPALAAAVVREIRPRAVAAGCALTVEARDEGVAAVASSIALRRTLAKLITRAVDSTAAGGRVVVRTEAALDDAGAPVARCEVHGTGPSVDLPARTRLAEQQPERAHAEAAIRAGDLGLLIVGDLVRSMEGNIERLETTLGGACFRLDLPAAPA